MAAAAVTQVLCPQPVALRVASLAQGSPWATSTTSLTAARQQDTRRARLVQQTAGIETGDNMFRADRLRDYAL